MKMKQRTTPPMWMVQPLVLLRSSWLMMESRLSIRTWLVAQQCSTSMTRWLKMTWSLSRTRCWPMKRTRSWSMTSRLDGSSSWCVCWHWLNRLLPNLSNKPANVLQMMDLVRSLSSMSSTGSSWWSWSLGSSLAMWLGELASGMADTTFCSFDTSVRTDLGDFMPKLPTRLFFWKGGLSCCKIICKPANAMWLSWRVAEKLEGNLLDELYVKFESTWLRAHVTTLWSSLRSRGECGMLIVVAASWTLRTALKISLRALAALMAICSTCLTPMDGLW